MNPKIAEAAKQITEKLANQGLIIEGGYGAFIIITGLEQAPESQKRQLKEAFYAGALHLFGSIMAILEPGEELTEKDLKRMSLINDELDRWIQSHSKGN